MTLVEVNERFVSCPISNLVLAGVRRIEDLTLTYDGLRAIGVRVVQDEAVAIELDRKQVRLRRGEALPFDRLVLSPGIDFQTDRIPGLAAGLESGRAVHAWRAGVQTVELRRQIEALRPGGVFAISIPKAPYRCPPGPYERASVVASYFKRNNPRAKIIVLDANPDIVSKKALFLKAWNDLYPGLIDYRPNSEAIEFDGPSRVLKLLTEDVSADVFNIIPSQQAGRIASPLVSVNGQWVGVDFRTFESTRTSGVYVIGDATSSAPGMPKSGFMANNHAKVAADAIIASFTGQVPNPQPIIANTCYSFVSEREAMHVASVHKWDEAQRTLAPVAGAGGLSSGHSETEGQYALAWAANIWADSFS